MKLEGKLSAKNSIKASISLPELLKGEQGIPGEPGVYLGTEKPLDPSIKVWINPEGSPADDSFITYQQMVDYINSLPKAEDLTV